MLWSYKKLTISWLRTMIDAILHVIQGSIALLSLGMITVNITFTYTIHCAKKDLKERMMEDKTNG